jgi:glycosidase
MHFSALRNSFAKYFADLFAWHWGRYQASWPGNPWSICLGGTRQNDVIGQWRKVKTGSLRRRAMSSSATNIGAA